MAYQHRRLNTIAHSREFRLLKVLHSDDDSEAGIFRCTLKHFRINNAPPYHALSYTWDSPFHVGPDESTLVRNTENIMIDGRAFSIGTNLSQCLKVLRHDSQRSDHFIWVDAICIDQTSAEERGHQVSLMGSIYSQAEKVVVWLGEDSDDSGLAVAFVKELAALRSSQGAQAILSQLAGNPGYQRHWMALKNLLQRRWWSRAWVLQETILARQIELLCGYSSLDWQELFDAVAGSARTRHVWLQVLHTLESTFGIRLNSNTVDVIYAMYRLRRGRLDGDPFPFLDCHYHTCRARAADPRDYIFSKLGFASDGGIVVPDYTVSTVQAYIRFVLSHIRAKNSLDIIHFPAASGTVSGLPSWVPDWSAGTCAVPLRYHAEERNLLSERRTGISAHNRSYSANDPLIVWGYSYDVVSTTESTSGQGSTELIYQSVEETFEALWRSLAGNTDAYLWDSPSPDMGYALAVAMCEVEELLSSGEHSDDEQFEEIYSRIRDLRVGQMKVKEWAALFGRRRLEQIQQQPLVDLSHARRRFSEQLATRIIITTKRGYIGIASERTESGDIVAILHGSSLPVILRRHHVSSSKHSLICGSYIHGISESHVGDAIHRYGLHKEEFELL